MSNIVSNDSSQIHKDVPSTSLTHKDIKCYVLDCATHLVVDNEHPYLLRELSRLIDTDEHLAKEIHQIITDSQHVSAKEQVTKQISNIIMSRCVNSPRRLGPPYGSQRPSYNRNSLFKDCQTTSKQKNCCGIQ